MKFVFLLLINVQIVQIEEVNLQIVFNTYINLDFPKHTKICIYPRVMIFLLPPMLFASTYYKSNTYQRKAVKQEEHCLVTIHVTVHT